MAHGRGADARHAAATAHRIAPAPRAARPAARPRRGRATSAAARPAYLLACWRLQRDGVGFLRDDFSLAHYNVGPEVVLLLGSKARPAAKK